MERLSVLDSAMLALETPTQHLNVVATLVLRPGQDGFDYEAFRARVAARFLLVDPMRRRLFVPPVGDPLWVDAHEMFVDAHLHHVVLDPPADLDALGRITADIAAQQLPRDRPLWEAWFVEGLRDGLVAVVAKVHHCAVDGISGIGALAAFFDLERGTPDDAAAAVLAQPGRAAPGPHGLVDVVRSALAHRPAAFATGLRALATTGRAALRTLWSATPLPALPLTAPRSPLSGALSTRRDVRFFDIALDDVKHVRKTFGATVNDVVVALCTGALRHYLALHDALPTRHLVAAVPMSERTPAHGAAGNAISTLFYRLPVEIDDIGERMLAVQETAGAAKQLSEELGPGLFSGLAGLTPPQVIGPLARFYSRSRLADRMPLIVNVLVSNVRGPEFPLWVRDARVEQLYPLGPLLEGAALNMTVVSYIDRVHFGLIACPDVVPHLDDLRDGIRAALDELLAIAT